MSTDTQESFQTQLETVYERYRHRSLEATLDDIAETMERTILQRVLAEAFLGTDVEIEDDAKQAVAEARELVEQNRYSELDSRLDELERIVEDQERRVSNQIQETRIEMLNTVTGMTRLNERVDRVDSTKLQAIETLLDDWDWKGQVYRTDNEDFETREDHAAQYGHDMREFFDEARDEIFGPYDDTPLEEIVDNLLSDYRLSLDELSDAQIDQLRDSDLDEYIELKLT